MNKRFLISILISSILLPSLCFAQEDTAVVKSEKTSFWGKFHNPIKSNKKNSEENVFIAEDNTPKPEKKSWKFGIRKKKNTENADVDNQNAVTSQESKELPLEDDTLATEKKKAVDDANLDLSKEFKSQYKIFDDIVEGRVQKSNTSESEITSTVTISENDVLSLDDCIKNALQNNPQIRSAISNSEIYKTKIGQAWSNYFPTFNLTSGYTRNKYFSLNFSVPQQYYNYFNAVNVSANFLLFDFGKTKATADMAKRTYESTVANLDETINTIVYDVKQAYYGVLYAMAKQRVYEDSVKSYELQLKQAESFYVIGTKPKIDVTMAQYNLGNAQLGYIKAKNSVKIAFAQLNNAMGLPEGKNYKVGDKFEKKDYDLDFDTLLKQAYESRPEILAYRKKVKASEALIRASKYAFTPNLEAVGAYQVGGGATYSDDYGWTVGAQLSYGLTNLMLLKKQVDEAKATHARDLADLRVKEHDVHLEVQEAFVNYQNAQESVPVTALSLKHAHEQYNLASGRYKVGEGNAIELKDSEVTYRNARLDYLAALLQYNISIADLERVVGFKLNQSNFEVDEK